MTAPRKAEVRWHLRAPMDRARLETALPRALESEYPDVRFTITAEGLGLALRTTLRDHDVRGRVIVEVRPTELVVRRAAEENASVWYTTCRVADLLARELGAPMIDPPEPALYAVLTDDSPITKDTPRFEPADVAAELFSDCDSAPYATMEPIEEVTARVERAMNRGYHNTLQSLFAWLLDQETDGKRVIGSVLEPDPFDGLYTYELEER